MTSSAATSGSRAAGHFFDRRQTTACNRIDDSRFADIQAMTDGGDHLFRGSFRMNIDLHGETYRAGTLGV